MVWVLDKFLELRNASDYMCLIKGQVQLRPGMTEQEDNLGLGYISSGQEEDIISQRRPIIQATSHPKETL